MDASQKSILVTAPSGSGKTTLVKMLMDEYSDNFQFSVSATTRPPRGTEKNGIDYHFISSQEFNIKIENQEFIEYEEVYEGIFYGTLKSEISRINDHNKTPIFDVDVKGAIRIKEILKENVLSIFIAPPSIDELERRLTLRGTENEEKIQMRIEKAKFEMNFADRFDYIVFNDNLENAYRDLKNKVINYLKI